MNGIEIKFGIPTIQGNFNVSPPRGGIVDLSVHKPGSLCKDKIESYSLPRAEVAQSV